MKATRTSMINFIVTLILITGSFIIPVRSIAATGNITTDLQVVLTMPVLKGLDYIELEGTMSGTVHREDGSQGTYKVPVTFFYPDDDALCNGAAILDLINSVFYETFETVGVQDNNSLFPLARMNLGDTFIKERGYVYAWAQWNKLVIDRQLIDPSLQIDRGTDGYLILRDLSNVLRHPSNFITGTVPIPCAVSNVIGFGYSQTGMLLRQFYFAGSEYGPGSIPRF